MICHIRSNCMKKRMQECQHGLKHHYHSPCKSMHIRNSLVQMIGHEVWTCIHLGCRLPSIVCPSDQVLWHYCDVTITKGLPFWKLLLLLENIAFISWRYIPKVCDDVLDSCTPTIILALQFISDTIFLSQGPNIMFWISWLLDLMVLHLFLWNIGLIW